MESFLEDREHLPEAGRIEGPALIAGCAAFAGVLHGYDVGIINGLMAKQYWRDTFFYGVHGPDGFLGAHYESRLISLLVAGALVGALSMPIFADWFGRRPGVIIATWFISGGVVVQLAGRDASYFIAGRFISGIGIGLVSALVPLFQSEMCPRWYRGMLVGSYHYWMAVGLVLAAVVNYVTSHMQDPRCYQIPIGLQLVWSFITFVIMYLVPDSPRFHIIRGSLFKATRTLSCMRDADASRIAKEILRIKANVEYERLFLNRRFRHFDCFRHPLLRRQITGMMIHAIQQLSGINFIIYNIFHLGADIEIQGGFALNLMIAFLHFGAATAGLWVANKYGRRRMLLWGSAGMALSLLFAAVCGVVSTSDSPTLSKWLLDLWTRKASFGFMTIFVVFYSSFWGPLPWVITGEIFPNQIRASSVSFAIATNWLSHLAVVFLSPYVGTGGHGNLYIHYNVLWLWFTVCLFSFPFAYFCIYETRNRSLEEINFLYLYCPDARSSYGWKVNEILMGEVHAPVPAQDLPEEDEPIPPPTPPPALIL